MQLNFVLSPQFQKSEYTRVLDQLQKEFSEKFPGIRKIVIEIKLHSRAVYKPAFIISGLVSDQLYKVRLNFEKLYKGSSLMSLPDPVEFCERIKLAVNKVVSLSRSSM